MINSKFTVTGQCLATQFSGGADAWSRRLSPYPGGSSTGELPKRERCPISKYQQLTFRFPHITDTHHPDNATLGWGHHHPLYRCVPLTSVTHVIGFWTRLTGLKNGHSFSILIVPTILSHAVLAHLISNYPWCACATRTALLYGALDSREM